MIAGPRYASMRRSPGCPPSVGTKRKPSRHSAGAVSASCTKPDSVVAIATATIGGRPDQTAKRDDPSALTMISALKAFCAIAGQKKRPRTFSIADAKPASDNPTRNGDIQRVSDTVSAYFSALSVNPSAMPRTSNGAPNQNSSTVPPNTQSSTPNSALARRHAP